MVFAYGYDEKILVSCFEEFRLYLINLGSLIIFKK